MATANAISVYEKKSVAGKVDFICKNYANFIGIVDSYTEGIRYMIEDEKATAFSSSVEELGIRVQKSRSYDGEQMKAINNVLTRKAIIECDFSGGILDGVENPERYIRDAKILRQMRKHYDLFNSQIKSLQPKEQDFFLSYLRRTNKLSDMADEAGIGYDSLIQKYNKTKKKITVLMAGFLEGTY